MRSAAPTQSARLTAARPALSAGMLVGMGTLRACAAGFGAGPLSDEAYRAIHAALERALADGALGVSLGLGYAPECFYDTEGLIRALAPLRRSGRVITVHMRQEGDGVEAALEEMLTAAKALETPAAIRPSPRNGTEKSPCCRRSSSRAARRP